MVNDFSTETCGVVVGEERFGQGLADGGAGQDEGAEGRVEEGAEALGGGRRAAQEGRGVQARPGAAVTISES